MDRATSRFVAAFKRRRRSSAGDDAVELHVPRLDGDAVLDERPRVGDADLLRLRLLRDEAVVPASAEAEAVVVAVEAEGRDEDEVELLLRERLVLAQRRLDDLDLRPLLREPRDELARVELAPLGDRAVDVDGADRRPVDDACSSSRTARLAAATSSGLSARRRAMSSRRSSGFDDIISRACAASPRRARAGRSSAGCTRPSRAPSRRRRTAAGRCRRALGRRRWR